MEVTQTLCKNCGNELSGRFCSQCGEKVYLEQDRSFKHLFEEVFHFLTHFDGNFLRTLKTMATRPGKFAEDFCSGIRKKYFKPISFFLLLVILYLLFPVFEGLNMKLRFYKTEFYGKYATEQSEVVKAKHHFNDEELEEAFHHKGEKVSKFLLFTTLPFMALVSYALGFKKRKYYFDHFIFATESASFFILFGFLLVPLIVILASLVGIRFNLSEEVLAIVIFSAFGIYVGIAGRRFFQFRYFYTIVYSLLFSLLLAFFLEFIYKFILFVIVIHLV